MDYIKLDQYKFINKDDKDNKYNKCNYEDELYENVLLSDTWSTTESESNEVTICYCTIL